MKVRDARNNNLIKQAAVPVTCVREGLRVIELYNQQNEFDGFSYVLLDVRF